MIEAIWADLRQALRALRKSPGATALALLCVGLGLGINATLFSLVNAAILRPLPGLTRTAELVNVHRTARGQSFLGFSYPGFSQLKRRSAGVLQLAGFDGRRFVLGGGLRPDLALGQLVSGDFFEVLGVKPELGRLLVESDDASAAPVVVISHALWASRFAGDTQVIGRSLRLNGSPFTIVGVTPAGFSGPFNGFSFALWAPLRTAPQLAPDQDLADSAAEWLELLGRLDPGVTRQEAQASLGAAAAVLSREALLPRDSGVDVRPLTGVDDSLREALLGLLGLLQATAGLVLLIAGVNVAGLLLARGLDRREELAVRLALGASRRSLVRPLLAEAGLLFGLGGALGLLLSGWLRRLVEAFRPAGVPLDLDLRIDARVVTFAAALSVVAALVFGLVPALRTARQDVVTAMRPGSRTTGGRQRLRALFVVGQVAASMLLLAVGGLLVRGLVQAQRLDPGFAASQVQCARLDVSLLAYDAQRGRDFYDRLVERLQQAPGVRAVAVAQRAPLGPGTLVTSIAQPGQEPVQVDLNVVSAGYFDTLRLGLGRGRGFLASDREGTPLVAIVSEALARRFWPDREALGQQLRLEAGLVTVVGVAQDSRYNSVAEAAPALLYLPFRQAYVPGQRVLVRTQAGPAAAAALIEREVAALDKDLPIVSSMPLQDWIDVARLPQRMAGQITGSLGALGVLLAGIGIYGIIAYSVNQRTREIGLRAALGANRRSLLGLVLGEGARLALGGVVLGGLAAMAVGRAVAGFVPGVRASDPLALLMASVVILTTALIASFVPARRAARLDPIAALREK